MPLAMTTENVAPIARYVAILRKDPTSDYSVDFPDFPGCITAGPTRDEAERSAEEALSFHVSGMLDDGNPLPEPRSIEVIMADPEHKGGTPFLVALSVQNSSRD